MFARKFIMAYCTQIRLANLKKGPEYKWRVKCICFLLKMNMVESVSIQPIDKNTVNQICSGQVVLSLAIAVKELLENSIDAGADSIQIKIEEYGSDSIEVIDNGCGVEEVNFQALTLKHHTSKIREFTDLYNVETFGFRGEALSSLCSLSDVTIITQHKNSDIGAILKFDHNGIITNCVKTLRKTGTTVRIENLFKTLPIRRSEFIKNLKREYNKMCSVLYAYGLLSKGVRITCTNVCKSKLTTQDKQLKKSTTSIMDIKGDSLESNIISIFGIKQKQNIIKIIEKIPTEETLTEFNLYGKNIDLNIFKLNGYISSCAHGCGRTTSDRQFYYINSRPIDNPKISKLVNEIYHQYNNKQDPFVVLNITVGSGLFDLNLTPDKRQILLQNEKLLFAVVKESLTHLYNNISSSMEVKDFRECFKPQENEVRERFEKFKANLKCFDVKKKEPTQSHIDSFIKFQVKTLPNDDKSIISPKSNSLDLYTLKPTVEIIEKVDITNNETKRKLGEVYIPDLDSKKLKIDDGLHLDDKNKRKTITYNITFIDIKNIFKNIKKKLDNNINVKFLSSIKPENNERAENELKKELKKYNFKQMEIIGQFNLGFIITKLDFDIFIIDQHASDEKYNYETLRNNTVMQMQKLFNPELLELTVDKEELMLQHRNVFNKNGFDFIYDNNAPSSRRIKLSCIPMSRNYIFGKDDVDELLFLLEDATDVGNIRPSRVDSMFASRACRKSVMIGTPLNKQEMRKIVDNMGDMEHPWNCPHGRPTMRHLINLQMINIKE